MLHLYFKGCSDDGALGRPGTEHEPILVEDLKNETIVGIACGDSHTLAISTKGEVWGWGCLKDKEGKKWFNPKISSSNPAKEIKRQQSEPILIDIKDRSGKKVEITAIACGASYNLAKSSDGYLYSWGIGECGELGRYAPPLKNDEEEYDFQRIYEHHITPSYMYYAGASDKGDNTG